METTLENIPVITKTKPAPRNIEVPASSCCTPKVDATPCCEPSKSQEDNDGACCAQPQDGSACCEK